MARDHEIKPLATTYADERGPLSAQGSRGYSNRSVQIDQTFLTTASPPCYRFVVISRSPLEGNAPSLPPKHHDILLTRKRQSVSLHTRDAGYLHVPIAQILTTASPPCYRFVAIPRSPLEGNAPSLPPKHHDILMKRKRQSVSLHTRDAGYLHVPIAQILTTASPPCYRFVAIPRSPLEGNAPSLPPKHRAPSPNWAVARACNARPSCGCRIESMLSGRLSFAARFPESVRRGRWFRRDR